MLPEKCRLENCPRSTTAVMGDSFLNLLERPIILTPQTDPNREPEVISSVNVHQGHEGRGYKSRAAKSRVQ